MWLNVRKLATIQLLNAVNREAFDSIHKITSIIVSPARIPFRVLICKDGSTQLANVLRSKVLGRYQLKCTVLTIRLVEQCLLNVFIHGINPLGTSAVQ